MVTAVDDASPLTGRAETEAKLEAMAIRLVARDGVLAGLNLREVADEAGVNRALVYRYFGSRRDLLRRAYHRVAERARPTHDAHREMPLRQRVRADASSLVRRPAWARMVFLLALDGDGEFRAMELSDATLGALRQDRYDGVLPADTDVEALHVFWFAALSGYAVLRDQLARDLAVDASSLDERVLDVIGRVVDALTAEPPTTGSPSTGGR